MSRLLRYILLFAVVLSLSGANVQAQEAADTVSSLKGIEIATSVDLAEMYIGDLLTYKVAITYDSTYKLEPPPLGANLGAFEVKDYIPDQETTLDDGRKRSETSFVLSTYTTGDYVIPALPVTFILPDSTRKVLLAEPVPIRVLSMLDKAGTDSLGVQDILPLEDPYEFPPDYSKYYLWGGIGLGVLLLAVGFFFWRRLRKKEVQEDLRTPWEIAFERLAFLNENYLANERVASDGTYKEYYLELTEITRDYLARIYRVDVLEMTTDQFVEAFADIDLPNDSFDRLSGFYKHADMVKFARFRPSVERARQDFELAHDVIEKVRADYEQRQLLELKVKQEESGPPPQPGETNPGVEEPVS